MYKKLLFLLALSYICSQLNGQDYIPTDDIKWRSLIGEVYILPFFVDTRYGEFETEEVEYYLEELDRAQAWIKEASEEYYDIELELIDDYFDTREEVIYIPEIYMNTSFRIKNRIAQELGYNSIDEFIEFYNFEKEKHKIIVLCFVKQEGRSHAYDANRSVFSKSNTIDHAIIYCHTKYGSATSYKVIAHEMLHMFRAWDLYEGLPQNPTKAEILKEKYPNSIMLSTYNNDNPVLDEINAWRIGWNLKPEREFMKFKPEYRKNAEIMKKKNRKEKIIFNLGENKK